MDLKSFGIALEAVLQSPVVGETTKGKATSIYLLAHIFQYRDRRRRNFGRHGA